MDALCDALVAITKAIDERDPESVAHGFLGGEHGYGAHWNTAVFEMRPYYWGECDCGSDERSERWHTKNPHADDCWQTERDRRWAAYDAKVGWDAIDRAAFGDDGDAHMAGFTENTESPLPGMYISTFEPRQDASMARWRVAYDKRNKARARIVRELYVERGLEPQPYQWFCSCGRDERAAKAELGHLATCAVELPNFRHKPSGFEVRWYKYIGRGMEVLGAAPDVAKMLAECLVDVGDAKLSSTLDVDEAQPSGGGITSNTTTPDTPNDS